MPASIRVQAKVLKIINHSDNIYTVQFSVPSRITRFKAGQFLHLALDDFNPSEGYWPESRVFSIASRPGTDILEIVYSVKGYFTKRMEIELKEGKQVWLKLPYGDFIFEKHIVLNQHAVFIAGGTGISPFIPYFYQVIEKGCTNPLTVYYGIRDQNHFLYQTVLEKISLIAKVKIVEGFLNIQTICRDVVKIDNAVCFISGPLMMIQSFQKELDKQGFPSNAIIIDSWE